MILQVAKLGPVGELQGWIANIRFDVAKLGFVSTPAGMDCEYLL